MNLEYSIDTPFQCPKNSRHHARSERKSALSRIQWSNDFVDRSIIRRRNDLPAGTTLQAWASRPMSDNKSLFLHAFLPLHLPRSACNLSNFARGRRICMASESSMIPKNEITLAGPSALSIARGSPQHMGLSHRWAKLVVQRLRNRRYTSPGSAHPVDARPTPDHPR